MYLHSNKHIILHSCLGTFKFNLANLINTTNTFNTTLLPTNTIISSSHFIHLHNINKLKTSSTSRIINVITTYPIILLLHNNHPNPNSPTFNHIHIIAILDGYHRTIKSLISNTSTIPTKLISYNQFLHFMSSSSI